MTPEFAGLILLRAIGSFAGTILALVFLVPRTLAELFSRGTACFVSGLVFGPQVADYLKWADGSDTTISAAAVAAFVSWWTLGAAVRLVSIIKIPGSEKRAED